MTNNICMYYKDENENNISAIVIKTDMRMYSFALLYRECEWLDVFIDKINKYDPNVQFIETKNMKVEDVCKEQKIDVIFNLKSKKYFEVA